MLEKIKEIIQKYESLTLEMTNPSVIANLKRYAEIAKKLHELEPITLKGKSYLHLEHQIQEDKVILSGNDEELKAIVKEEIEELIQKQERLKNELTLQLLPKDPRDEKNTIMEIRAGTGGDEAAIFAGDLFRMYIRYAERNGWAVQVLNSNPTGNGGFKEIIFSLEGNNVYSRMKFEAGVHRVQRVPVTESGGRIHTSAATVAVLPEADEIDIKINPEDIRVDTFRASGHGGQHINKTESAVRITHLPTGLVVTCQDEKSQHKNRASAMKVLRSRLLELEKEKQREERDLTRRSMISTGDRSAKIRTYNFPQNRVTDHRIDCTLYKLQSVLDGEINEFIEKLHIAHQLHQLKQHQT